MNNNMSEAKNKIEKRIDEILDFEINQYKNNEFIVNSLEELKRLSKDGKRVRGYLIKLGQLLFGKDDDSYIDIAAAIEIFQTAILIHDDIIDEADKRRGMQTIHSKYKGHIGVSKAICIGDLGFFLSYKIISNIDVDSEIKNLMMKIYSKTLYNTVNGEIIDVELPLKDISYHEKMDEKIIYDIYLNKTAWYTIIGPILIGAISAKADSKSIDKLIEIGSDLGIAFQIKDDLLGLYSNSNLIGKTLNDIKENKQTIIYKYAIDNASKEELDIINKYYGTEENNDLIIDLFEKIGAKKNAEDLVEKFTNYAIDKINNIEIQNRELFIEFCNYLLKREK